MRSIHHYVIAVLIALTGIHCASAVAGNDPDLVAADVLTGVIPLSGLAVAYFSGDIQGEKQWLRNTGVALVVTSTLKLAFNQTSLGKRPDGSPYGFPSGHAAFVMSGAAFLNERYGWKWGLPAIVGAAYVAYVRVDEGKHHWRDVIAGGALSYGVAMLTVTPEHATHLAPVIGPGFLGLRWERSF